MVVEKINVYGGLWRNWKNTTLEIIEFRKMQLWKLEIESLEGIKNGNWMAPLGHRRYGNTCYRFQLPFLNYYNSFVGSHIWPQIQRHAPLWIVPFFQRRMTPMMTTLITLVSANLGMSQVIYNSHTN